MFQQLTDTLIGWAQMVPLPFFTFAGAFIEEVVAPIPSPVVMTLTGSIAASQNLALTGLGTLALIGAVGKTIGSYIVYFVADKAEDFLVKYFGKIFEISHDDMESIGQALGKGKRDYLVITLMRAIPIFPTAPVSIAAGIVKLNLKTYITGTFIGTFFRNIFYLYVGYSGLSVIEEGLDSAEKVMQFVLFGLFAFLVFFFYYQRRISNPFKRLVSKLKRYF